MSLIEIIVEHKEKGKSKRFLNLKCDVCNSIFLKRYMKPLLQQKHHFCSKNCVLIARKKNGLIDIEKARYNLEKYGVEYPSKLKSVQEKQKATNKKRYGVEYVGQNAEIRKKQTGTSMEKYGTPYSFLNEEIKSKIKETNKRLYGTENPTCSPEIILKRKETNKRLYGNENYVETQQFKEKSKQTCLERYGVDNSFKDKTVRQKYKNTMKEKYGYEHNFMVPELREKAFKKSFINGKHKVSKVEDKFFSLLVKAGYSINDIERQKYINKKWIIDFYIETKNLYIQIDGVYWHGLDRPYKQVLENKTKRGASIIQKYKTDKTQNKWFKKNNLTLIRFTDQQIIKISSIEELNCSLLRI